jgi:hypothetical protein
MKYDAKEAPNMPKLPKISEREPSKQRFELEQAALIRSLEFRAGFVIMNCYAPLFGRIEI